MKLILSAFTALLLLSACANNENKATSADAAHETSMQHNAATDNKFADVQFALDKDPVCQMPLSAGVSDTAVIDGKVYGFCAIECKDTYVKEHRK